MLSYIYIYINLPVNAIVRLPHPRSGDITTEVKEIKSYSELYTYKFTSNTYKYTYQYVLFCS